MIEIVGAAASIPDILVRFGATGRPNVAASGFASDGYSSTVTCRANRNGVFFVVQTKPRKSWQPKYIRQEFFFCVGGKLPCVQARNT